MCGICGVVDTRGQGRIDRHTVAEMTAALSHRGPDGSDIFISENVGLGFTRLSIVGLENGMQPIFNEDNSLVLICNGEIFNYLDLKQQLLKRGHRFRTNSDVEVILHLYEEFDEGFLNLINGQFAFVIYDSNKGELFGARDHVGICPFHYTMVNGVFVFGSEIKSILQHPYVERTVNLTGLDQLLTFPGLIAPETLFQNIYALESGHFIRLSKPDRIEKKEYWDLTYPREEETRQHKDEDEEFYIEQLDELLNKAVRRRLQADVPVGFYISGGLDSSIIAAKAANESPGGRFKSFSILFDDEVFSEHKFQRQVAHHVGSDHHEYLFSIDDIFTRMKKVIYHSESALRETYNAASIALSNMVKSEGIKVILTGEGADELFAGYVGYGFDLMRQQTHNDRTSLVSDRDGEIRGRIWGNNSFIYEKNLYNNILLKEKLFSRELAEQMGAFSCLNRNVINREKVEGVHITHLRSYVDFKLRLSEHLLGDHGDRMAFANSVEHRYPFLDKDVIEFATKIHPGLKIKNFQEKYILKQIAKKYVPNEVVKRPKFSFVAPASPAIIKRNYEMVHDILSYSEVKRQGYFNPEYVEQLKMKYSAENFSLNVPFDEDILILVLTFSIFKDLFKVS